MVDCERFMNTALKLTVGEYDEMVAKGAFDGLSQKVQLIEGEILAMNPAGPRLLSLWGT